MSHIGHIPLDSNDAEGELLLESAMQQDEQLLPKAAPIFHAYFQRQGSLDRIRDLHARMDRFDKSVRASHEERSNVTASDEFISHELEQADLDNCANCLKRMKTSRRRWSRARN